MDNWEAVLKSCASFIKRLSFRKNKKWGMLFTTIPMCWYEFVGIKWTHGEPWIKRRSLEKNNKIDQPS